MGRPVVDSVRPGGISHRNASDDARPERIIGDGAHRWRWIHQVARRHTLAVGSERAVSRRTTGATCVPKSSIDRMTWACGMGPTLICARNR